MEFIAMIITQKEIPNEKFAWIIITDVTQEYICQYATKLWKHSACWLIIKSGVHVFSNIVTCVRVCVCVCVCVTFEKSSTLPKFSK